MLTKPAKRREITDNPTSGYQSSGMMIHAWMSGQLHTSEPWFLWSDVPVMGRDPAIKIGIRVLRSRFRKVKIKKNKDGKTAISGPPKVRRFIWRTWRKFWYSCLPALMNHYYKWGRAPGGVEWMEDKRKGLQLDTVRAIEPWDVTPYVHGRGKRRNQFAGFAIRNAGPIGDTFVSAPHAFYFAGFQEFAPFCDEPRIAGAYTPWLEKNAPTGLRSSRRLYYWTRALGLTVVRHPDEPVKMPNGSTIPSEVVAIQAGVLARNGSIVAMPSTLHPGDKGKFKWDLEQRQGQGDTAKIGEAVEAADREIWYGMGILPEIIQSGESGGYAGRSVSMETWLADADLEAGMWDSTFRSQVLAPIIWARFGVPPSGWDYELNSLLEEYLASATPHGPGNQSPSPGNQSGGGGQRGGSDFSPDGHQTQSGHQRLSNAEGKHRYLSSMGAAKSEGLSKDDKLALKARTAAALAMIEHRLAELESGQDSEDGEDHRQALAELADDPAELGNVLGSINLSWVAYGQSRSGKTRWKDEETGRLRYQNTRPGEHTEKRLKAQADAATAKHHLSKIVQGNHTIDDLHGFANHIGAMTRSELQVARAQLQARFRSGSTRDQMVRALQEHVGGRIADARAVGENEPKGPKLRDDGTPESPRVEDVHTVDPNSLKRDPKRFQYKVSGIGEGGVSDELKGTGKYNPELGGTLLVWRDPETGEDNVVNGHHRHELAQRTGAPAVNVRYIEAPNAKIARAKGALANIAEGRGTATDAAKYLRDTGSSAEDMHAAGISLSGKVASDAVILSKLGDKAFGDLTAGKIDEAQAVAVARHLDDPKLQDLLFKKLEQREEAGKDWSTRQIEQAAKKMAAAGKVTEKGSDLFGEFEDEKSTFDQEVELEDSAARSFAQTLNDFGAVSSESRAGRIAGAGNVLATGENQQRRERARQEAETFHLLVHRKGPIADAVKAGAAKLASAKTKKERDGIRQETTEQIRKAVGDELDGTRKTVDADTGGTEGSVSGRGAADAVPAESGTSKPVEPATGQVDEPPPVAGRDLFGGALPRTFGGGSKGAQLTLDDQAKAAWTDRAGAWADSKGLKIAKWDAGGRFTTADGTTYQVGKAEDDFPVTPVSAPRTGPSVFTQPAASGPTFPAESVADLAGAGRWEDFAAKALDPTVTRDEMVRIATALGLGEQAKRLPKAKIADLIQKAKAN